MFCIYYLLIVFYCLPNGIYAEISGFLLRLAVEKDILNMCFLLLYENHTKGEVNLIFLEYF